MNTYEARFKEVRSRIDSLNAEVINLLQCTIDEFCVVSFVDYIKLTLAKVFLYILKFKK